MNTLRLEAEEPLWRRFCADPDRLDAGLRSMLDADDPIALTSRFSSPTGANARTSAINSLYEAAQVLLRQTGIDLTGVLPSREDLDVRLRNAPLTRSPRLKDGKDIQHRFVTMDLRPKAPVVLLLATGTGKIAAEGFMQPFTMRAAELVWEKSAAIVATKRWDRTTRNEDLVGPLLMAMEEQGAWVCATDVFDEMNERTRLYLRMKSWSAGENTGDEDHAKRLGQADRTGRRIVDGQVAYHLPVSVPPGLGVVTLRRRPGVDLEKVAYLDTPGCRPDRDRVADGLSEVRDDDGDVVDQVANVQFFLAHYGDPEWMEEDRLEKELRTRQFSTANVRNLYGASASVTKTRGHTAWRSILDNLDVYENGVLRRAVGGDVPDVEISGVVPPDGPWASAEDFARIRQYMAKGRARAGKSVRLSLAGLSATYNGTACRTRSVASPSSTHEDEPCLSFRRVRDDGTEVRVDEHVLLPYRSLAESLADAIVSAGAVALEPLLASIATADEARAGVPAGRLAEVEEEIAALEGRSNGLLAQLGEVHEDGRPVLRGKFLQAAQHQFEKIVDEELPPLQEERERLSAQVDAAINLPAEVALDPGLLLHLLQSLRDPTDCRYSKLWRRVVANLELDTAPGAHPGKNSRRLDWTGVIKLDGGPDGIVALPFSGSFEYRRVAPGRGVRHVERRHEFLDALIDGIPYAEIDVAAPHANRPRVAKLLKIEDGHPIFTCTDPDIIRTAAALLAADSGVRDVPLPSGDAAFVEAVRRVHVDDRSSRPWTTSVAPLHAAMYELAADDGSTTVAEIVERCDTTPGTVHTEFAKLRRRDPNWTSLRKKGYRLVPCPNCGSHNRRPATIAEIHGLVCLNCEHDEAGVPWPLDRYGDFIAGGQDRR